MKNSIFILLIAIIISTHLPARPIDSVDGYPCCNFSIGANISAEGEIYGNIINNPAIYGHWLNSLGHISTRITIDGTTVELKDFSNKMISRNWPFIETKISDNRITNIEISTFSYAPIAFNNDFISSLPVIITEFKLTNRGSNRTVRVNLSTNEYIESIYYQDRTVKDCTMLSSANKFIAVLGQNDTQYIKDKLTETIHIPSGETKSFTLVTGIYDENGKTSQKFNSPLDIVKYTSVNLNTLKETTQELSDKLPEVNDPEINRYLRWHMIPAVILTKNMKDGNVLTMGYSELNQRDSFWTSFAHLLFWPDLEKRMIQESIKYQREDGKIPTTILPLIERNDDIDITCYFVLRIARYFKQYNDQNFLNECYPAMKKAISFLESLDKANEGMPQQQSFWADWKDVSGINGRKYAPHMAFTYLAALKEVKTASEKLNYKEDAEKFKKMYSEADTRINKHVKDGGLWNGKYYQQTWFDTKLNQTNQKLLQDQAVGIVFDVMPKDRAQKVLAALDQSITKYGVAETMPYYPDSFGYPQGCYHNGGMWPYLNYMHSWALIKSGRKEDGINLMKRCAWATLENNKKYLPYEYINSINGTTGGHSIQGWNADFIAAVYFGILQNSN